MKKKVYVVGPLNIYPRREDVRVGDILTFEKNLDSTYGKTVKVFFESEHIGFISASFKTNAVGCELAEDIFDNEGFEDNFQGEVIEIDETTRRGGIISNYNFIVEVTETETENILLNEEDNDMKKTTTTNTEVTVKEKVRNFVTILTAGPEIPAAIKYSVAKILKNNPTLASIEASLDIQENQVAAKFKQEDGTEVVCGYIIKKEDLDGDGKKNSKLINFKDRITTSEELIQYINDCTYDGKVPTVNAYFTRLDELNGCGAIMELHVDVTGTTKAAEKAEKYSDNEVCQRAFTAMSKLGLSEKVVFGIMEYIYNSLPQNEARIPRTTKYKNENKALEQALISIVTNSNTMLSGPLGCGKNTCIEYLANLLNKALYEVQVNCYIDNDTLLGTRTFEAKDGAENAAEINKQGKLFFETLAKCFKGESKDALAERLDEGDSTAITEVEEASGLDFSILLNAMKNDQASISFQPSVIVKAMEEGAWVVLDEFNAGPPAVMTLLNSILDDRKRLDVPGYGKVEAAPGFRVFATMNPGYAGMNGLNPATASRFQYIRFESTNNIQEVIKSNVPEITKDFLSFAYEIYVAMKHQEFDHDGRKVRIAEANLNPRGFIRAAQQNVLGVDAKTALINCVANSIENDRERGALVSYIDIKRS